MMSRGNFPPMPRPKRFRPIVPPCEQLGYCCFGPLIVQFEGGRKAGRCHLYDHFSCPAYYVSEDTTEVKVWLAEKAKRDAEIGQLQAIWRGKRLSR
jgi:hypothetical protein